jgi:hypothetical protein
MKEPQILKETQIMNKPQNLKADQFPMKPKLQFNPKFQISLIKKKNWITNAPQILKDHKISK